MARRNKKPKPIGPQIIESLKSAVPLGEYCMYSASSQLPVGVPWGGPKCQRVVVAASSHTGSEIPGLPSNLAPVGPVILWRAFRTMPGGSPPGKVDDCLYYQSGDGNTWSVHSKDSPDHHSHVMSGCGLGALIQDYNLPSASRGSISNYRSEGANLAFEKPFE